MTDQLAATETARKAGRPGRASVVWGLVIAIVVVPTLLLAVWLWSEAGGESGVDPEMVRLAEQNAGGPVQVFTGTEHTIYHSAAPLPSASNPRADGRRTVVWLTRATCAKCAGMRPFAQQVAAEFRGEAAFVEKSVDRDSALSRGAIPDLPSFQVLAPDGAVIASFGFQPTAEAFRAALTGGLNSED